MSKRSRRARLATDQAAAGRSASGTLVRSSDAARREARTRRGQDRTRSLRRFVMPSLLGAAIVAGFSLLVGSQLAGPSSAGDLPATRPVLGRSDATLVIREYGDFQCPSCGAFFRVVEPQIRAAFIDTGLARLEWHDFAWIGQESRDAANAARCAGDQGRFWDFHDLLYRSQSGENVGAFAKDRLKAMGVRLGLEPVAFHACVDGNGHANAVQSDFAEARSRGFNATPTFLVGDQRIVGAQPFEVFAAAINAELGLN